MLHKLSPSDNSSVSLKTLYIRYGILIRDVRGLHRGTPNVADIPRPMVVVGYSRKWLRRPEVGINIPQTAKRLLRYESIVPDEVAASYDGIEKYDAKTLTNASGQGITLE